MTIERETVIKLIADEGMVLTNTKTYGKVVYLSKNDSPDNWFEIPEETYHEIIGD